ncbi:MAG: thioredoxin domain-containing protein [Ahniella sp.]|nr:thioredoxin domain-containing protein [Ahniella sp.]
MRKSSLGLLMMILMALTRTGSAGESSGINWQRDDQAAFVQAREEQRFVLLYLEAVWCHWCHVMDHKTYGDPRVQALIGQHYVPLRIDQDLRPDLANRYRDWGWPATIVFDAEGREIVKRQGFVAPENFARLLQAIVDDPSPEASARLQASNEPVDAASSLPADLRETLAKRHQQSFDPIHGGLKTAQKYLDRDQADYALAHRTDPVEAQMAETSLTGASWLLDPVWGGVYQYSTGGDWNHPHFEKLTRIQAEYLRVYSQACAQLKRPADCRTADGILRYLRTFMRSDDGAFFTSQDADVVRGEHAEDYFSLGDAKRREQGIPIVDQHRYAAENGLVIEALALRAEWLGDADALADARKAAEWVITERAIPGGGFRHDEKDQGGPFLADTLAMGRAFVALYRATGERVWLKRAMAGGDFLIDHFRAPAGYYSAQPGRSPISPAVQLDEVLATGRFLNLLGHYSGQASHTNGARHALSWLAQREVALSRLTDAGILLLDEELNKPPLHVVVVGSKTDPIAADLFRTLQSIDEPYKRIEWWDRAEGELIHHDVQYPKLKRAAAFVCTDKTCSLPLTDPDAVRNYLTEDSGITTLMQVSPASAFANSEISSN